MGKCLWIGSSQRLWQIEAQPSVIPYYASAHPVPGLTRDSLPHSSGLKPTALAYKWQKLEVVLDWGT